MLAPEPGLAAAEGEEQRDKRDDCDGAPRGEGQLEAGAGGATAGSGAGVGHGRGEAVGDGWLGV